MTIEERIRRNREMESRIAAQEASEAPAREAIHRRKLARLVTNFVFSLPEDMRRDAAKIAVRTLRPDLAPAIFGEENK